MSPLLASQDIVSLNKLKESKTMIVTMSSDHRVVDGALTATWLKRFKYLMENPLRFLL